MAQAGVEDHALGHTFANVKFFWKRFLYVIILIQI